MKTVGIVFKTKDVIKSTTGTTIDDYLKNSQDVIDKLSDGIVKPIFNHNTDETTRTTPTSQNPDFIRSVPPMYQDRNPLRDFRDPLRDIGRGDLDPFGRGGGMLFQPDPRPNFGPINPAG